MEKFEKKHFIILSFLLITACNKPGVSTRTAPNELLVEVNSPLKYPKKYILVEPLNSSKEEIENRKEIINKLKNI